MTNPWTAEETKKASVEPGRLLAVGDIHGCRDQLRRLLAEVAPGADDLMVFMGDFIDRGPDSRGVLADLIEFRRHFPQSVFLRGNHEQMFLDYLDGRDRLSFLLNGGTATLKSYGAGTTANIPEEHLAFLRGLPCRYDHGEFVFVHAGLRPGIPLAEQKDEDLLWIRREFLDSDFDWGRTIVFGHTPQQAPLLEPRRIGVDTGAVYGRVLTCCEVRTRRCWQAA